MSFSSRCASPRPEHSEVCCELRGPSVRLSASGYGGGADRSGGLSHDPLALSSWTLRDETSALPLHRASAYARFLPPPSSIPALFRVPRSGPSLAKAPPVAAPSPPPADAAPAGSGKRWSRRLRKDGA